MWYLYEAGERRSCHRLCPGVVTVFAPVGLRRAVKMQDPVVSVVFVHRELPIRDGFSRTLDLFVRNTSTGVTVESPQMHCACRSQHKGISVGLSGVYVFA